MGFNGWESNDGYLGERCDASFIDVVLLKENNSAKSEWGEGLEEEIFTGNVIGSQSLEDVEVDEELVGFKEIVDEGEKFTWDTLVDNEEEDVVPGISQDEPTLVD